MIRKVMLAIVLLGMLVIAFVSPASAQTNVVWSGQYYNNPTLSEPTTFTRQETAIAFNWGQGSPGTGINADNFTVRWATDVVLPAGTYRFYALADDNISIVVDFNPIPLINTFNTAQVGQTLSADVTLGAGSHHIQVDYREVSSTAYAYVSFANLATNPTGPTFGGTGTTPIASGNWTAQYFPNQFLSGSPTLIQSEANPGMNWGLGSPVASIPADNWSARWTSTLALTGGSYQISATADDGVRVYVDGVLYINEWHESTGQTYSVTLPLIAGNHSFQVEYYEAFGIASLNFTILQPNAPAPTPIPATPQPTGATATVTAFQLNVRSAPSTSGAILTRINRGQTYSVIGVNPSNTWVQINVNNTIGWVSKAFVFLSTDSITVVNPTNPIPAPVVNTGYIVTATPFNVKIRLGPGTQFGQVGRMPVGQTASVVGRNATNTWWQVNYNGIVGWMSAVYAPIQANADLNLIPVTG